MGLVGRVRSIFGSGNVFGGSVRGFGSSGRRICDSGRWFCGRRESGRWKDLS